MDPYMIFREEFTDFVSACIQKRELPPATSQEYVIVTPPTAAQQPGEDRSDWIALSVIATQHDVVTTDYRARPVVRPFVWLTPQRDLVILNDNCVHQIIAVDQLFDTLDLHQRGFLIAELQGDADAYEQITKSVYARWQLISRHGYDYVAALEEG